MDESPSSNIEITNGLEFSKKKRREIVGPTPINIPETTSEIKEKSDVKETLNQALSPKTKLRLRIAYSKGKRQRQRNVNKQR